MQNGKRFITVKRKVSVSGAAVRREEHALSAGADALAKVQAWLCAAGLLPEGAAISPDTFLAGKSAGAAAPTAFRTTRRIVRRVRRAADGASVGTLCLDRVRHERAPGTPEFFDLEIEADFPVALDGICTAAQLLSERCPGALVAMTEAQVWRGRLPPRRRG